MTAYTDDPQPGLRARLTTICPRCDVAIVPGDRYVFARGRAIHVQCAAGADDE